MAGREARGHESAEKGAVWQMRMTREGREMPLMMVAVVSRNEMAVVWTSERARPAQEVARVTTRLG